MRRLIDANVTLLELTTMREKLTNNKEDLRIINVVDAFIEYISEQPVIENDIILTKEEFLRKNALRSLCNFVNGGHGSSYCDIATVRFIYGEETSQKVFEINERCYKEYEGMYTENFRKKWGY